MAHIEVPYKIANGQKVAFACIGAIGIGKECNIRESRAQILVDLLALQLQIIIVRTGSGNIGHTVECVLIARWIRSCIGFCRDQVLCDRTILDGQRMRQVHRHGDLISQNLRGPVRKIWHIDESLLRLT